jgi:hypothetical protein
MSKPHTIEDRCYQWEKEDDCGRGVPIRVRDCLFCKDACHFAERERRDTFSSRMDRDMRAFFGDGAVDSRCARNLLNGSENPFTPELLLSPPDGGLFGFEKEYSDDLHFIPIGMRYRLDLAGLKVGLAAWLGIPVPERFFLLKMPIGTGGDIAAFRDRLSRSLADCLPTSIACADPAAWANDFPPPQSVREACESAGMPIEAAHWSRFPELQRYALKKLSLSRRQPDAFRKAMEEFSSVKKDPPE